ncbi:MAG: HAMP domain-containing histidine kinase [Betaproteobacteria bacterium]|nr:HAMP domain-containing histidine kinase [Betaproteobacteria bacterium]
MFRTLYSKLAGVLLLLFLAVGTALVLATLHFFVAYNQEATQKLNQKLAHHLLEQNRLITPEGYDSARLKSLFDMQMAINPSIEIYLLDNEGRVVEYSAAPGKVKLAQVALDPIRRFLSGNARLPILGNDPRNPGTWKIFSAAAIPGPNDGRGFLYVILANEEQDSIGSLLAGSYILRVTVGEVAVGVLFAVLTGMLIFAFMTRRLEHLAEVMANFQRGEFSTAPVAELPAAGQNSDEIDRLAGTFREMSIRMVDQVRELTHNDVLRRELVANVSHDLKTPLASLQGYVDTLLLKDGSLSDEERRHYLLVASRSGERLAKLIGDLIELAKLDAREVKLSREAFPVAELMQDVMQKFQLRADQKQIKLAVNLPRNPPFVCADIGLIERVLENLIGNAIAHTSAGGSVSLDLKSNVQHAVVAVADSGCGIPEEEIPHIFDRFYRVNDDQRARGEHAGLGLAISRSILELHESRIDVASRPGVGTEFRFTLPVAQSGSLECAA